MQNINEIKDRICDVCHKTWQLGWVAANDGNVSARLENGNIIATPTGMSKSFITPDKLILLDSKGNVLEAAEGLRPSSEIKMHLRCYDKREDVMSVIHAHPPCATALSALGEDLTQPVLTDACLLGVVPALPYAPIGSDGLAAAVAEAAGGYNAALLACHGACTWGRTVQEALFHMETLEHVCRHVCLLRMMGAHASLSREESERLILSRIRAGKRRGGRHMPPLEEEG